VSGELTYYNLPLLKEPVWKLDIPTYYYLGGAAGTAFALGAAAQLFHDRRLDGLIRHCHWIGIIGSTVGAGLLVHDLGRPERFLNMLRVFRPTSPMNLGAWILAGAAPLGIISGLLTRSSGGVLAVAGEFSGYGAGLFGTALAGYTGVLVGNTAIPVWKESRLILPILFYASSMASVASLLELTFQNPLANRITFLFGSAGRVAELTAAYVMEKEASRVPGVGKPLREGASGMLWKTAGALTAASLVLSILPGKSVTKRRVAGILGTIGALCLRFAIHYAGIRSSRDPTAGR
jgi:formate-dependent nitrite reductase membrane component NrfD